MRYLTPEEYGKLSDIDKCAWRPEYKSYKEKRRRTYDYCESCNHKCFTGWEMERVPVGEPYCYTPCGTFERIGNEMMLRAAKELMTENVLTKNMLGMGIRAV